MSLVSRRSFLKAVAGTAGSLALSRIISPSLLLAQSVGAGSGKNFIVVNLNGGVDGLSMLPYYRGTVADTIRARLRPALNVAANSVIPVISQGGDAYGIGLHPALAPLATAAGSNMKIIQRYGIAHDPGRSHDTCQILFSLGRETLQGGDVQGVLARLMDQQHWESFQYWAIGTPPMPDVNTRQSTPIVLSELASFNYGQLGAERDVDVDFAAATQRALLEVQVPRHAASEKYKTALATMHRVVSVLRTDIAVQQVGGNSAGTYSDQGTGPNFRDAARILKAKSTSSAFGQRDKDTIIYLNQSGYDTHSNQLSPDSGLSPLLSDLGQNLAVLVQDLKSFGLWQNTVVLVFSEFGRTNFENATDGSVGTDHGWGNNTFMVGGPIRTGIVGEPPSASELLDEEVNALVPAIDFRRIWGDVLQWLGVPPASILDEPGFSYSSLGIIG